jgi:hypothetical protein
MSFGRPLLMFLCLALPIFPPPAKAAVVNLQPETEQAWNEYLAGIRTQIDQRLTPGRPFLRIEEKLKSGEIVVLPAIPGVPKRVPAGLIHDWVGATFIPNVAIDDVLPVLRDYSKYKIFFRPNVIDSKTILTDESGDRFSMVLMNRTFFKKIALDSDYQASYIRVDEHRMYSISHTTRIREIADYGAPSQHLLPEDQGTGLIWRLFSISRFEERDGGLHLEIEAIALSRDIPGPIRFFAEPIVRRVSRDSLVTTLKQTEAAIHPAP